MDVLVLIDKLDDLVHNAKAVPLTDQVRIDREEIYDILDQMRATIPEEIKQARWIVKERQEMLAEAKREQDRLLQEAREQAVREASQTEIVKLAERQAQEIIDEARRQAREMRLEMEDWADGMLATLEVNLDKFLTAVRRGRERLHERSQETVVAGIGPIDVGDDGSSYYRRPGRSARRYAAAMTSFRPSPAEAPARGGVPEAIEVELPAFAFGGQRYLPVPETVTAELVDHARRSPARSSRSSSPRGSTGPATAASATPCSTCRSATASTRRLARRRGAKTPYLATTRLEAPAWARDAVALALPDQILCRPDCAGLCPECGQNLNDEPHEHDETRPIHAGPPSTRSAASSGAARLRAAPHGCPEEEDLEIPPRQASRPALALGAARQHLPALPLAEAARTGSARLRHLWAARSIRLASGASRAGEV